MAERTAGSIRARVRAELTDEIKAVARRHLSEEGANMSMRAVARELGMASSAVYRYFPSRDDLLTALIVDAYNALGDAAETADAAVIDRTDTLGRWRAVTHAMRDWSRSNPHEYALLYGSPVPGYAAPADTVAPAARSAILLGSILADAVDNDQLADVPEIPLLPSLDSDLARIATNYVPGLPSQVLARALMVLTQVLGAISLELFGHFANTVTDLDYWFDLQVRAGARFVGLTEPIK